MALYFECRLNKKRTPSDRFFFLAILPTGSSLKDSYVNWRSFLTGIVSL